MSPRKRKKMPRRFYLFCVFFFKFISSVSQTPIKMYLYKQGNPPLSNSFLIFHLKNTTTTTRTTTTTPREKREREREESTQNRTKWVTTPKRTWSNGNQKKEKKGKLQQSPRDNISIENKSNTHRHQRHKSSTSSTRDLGTRHQRLVFQRTIRDQSSSVQEITRRCEWIVIDVRRKCWLKSNANLEPETYSRLSSLLGFRC